MHGDPLVSIIIPAFNSAATIGKTLESAVGQHWPNLEVIVVDDGSTDQTIEVVQRFGSKNSIKVFSQKKQGACKARNFGFQQSKGDFIQYLDSDDFLSPDKISSQLQLIADDEGDVVLSSRLVRFFDDEKLPGPPSELMFLEKNWNDPVEWLIHEWGGKGMGQTSVWLTPRGLIEVAGPWDERLSINQDGEFFSRVLLNAKSIRFSERGLVYYRSGNRQSVSQSLSEKKVSDLLLSYKLYERNVLQKENSSRVKHALASKYMSFIYSFCDSHPAQAREAWLHFRGLGIEKVPEAGGKNFKILARLTGFENALRIRSLTRKFLN